METYVGYSLLRLCETLVAFGSEILEGRSKKLLFDRHLSNWKNLSV